MPRKRLLLAYLTLVALPLVLLVLVLKAGSGMSIPGVNVITKRAVVVPAAMNLVTLALQVSVVLFVSRLVGMLFRKFRQPQVIGEMIAGIMMRSRMGTLAIACAAVDDLTGWCILAYIVVLIRSANSASALWVTVGGSTAYLLVMFFVVRPLLPRFEASFKKHGKITDNALSFVIVLALLSALATETLGIYAVFGAFFMGAILPKDLTFVNALMEKLESLTVVAFLPLFFAFSGLRTSIRLVQGELWIYAALVIVAAIAGKFGGSTLASRMAGVSWRESASLGVLMNARGLMELIALNIGLDIGVISPTLFTIMVLMAVVTTVMTPPLFELLNPSKLTVVQAERAA